MTTQRKAHGVLYDEKLVCRWKETCVRTSAALSCVHLLCSLALSMWAFLWISQQTPCWLLHVDVPWTGLMALIELHRYSWLFGSFLVALLFFFSVNSESSSQSRFQCLCPRAWFLPTQYHFINPHLTHPSSTRHLLPTLAPPFIFPSVFSCQNLFENAAVSQLRSSKSLLIRINFSPLILNPAINPLHL